MLRRHPFLAILSVGYLAVVALMTLGPQPLGPSGQNVLWRMLAALGHHQLTDWVTYDRVEFLANIAMFVPFGLLFVLLFGPRFWWLAVLSGIATTVAIELAQRGISGRVSDPRDVLANSLGAVIGVLFALVVTAPSELRRRRRRRALTTGEIRISR